MWQNNKVCAARCQFARAFQLSVEPRFDNSSNVSVLCLAKKMLGDDYKEAVLELNASDDR